MTSSPPEPASSSTKNLPAWLKQNRTRLQTLMLILALSAPFGLYWALQSGSDGAAIALFVAIAISLAAVIFTS